jgi:putative (di)nucleoside polyphosphate hydrolase
MTVIHKAVAAVVRRNGTGADLLAFRHPLADVQLPKGTVEPGETPAEGVMRELEEESGLRFDGQPRPIGEWRRVIDGKFGERATGAVQLWHVFVLDAPEGLPDSWTHEASGSPQEEGLTFAFRWLPIDADLGTKLHPVFGASVAMLVRHLESESGVSPGTQD